MKDRIINKILIQVFTLIFLTLSVSAQSFHFRLLAEPISNGAEVEFTPVLPETATFVRWEINGDEFITSSVNYTFDTSTTFDFEVSLFYTNPDLENITATINVVSPLFRVEPDKELGPLASLKRVFRSEFNIEDNNSDLIGSWRFDWAINNVKPEGISFPSPFGDFPNVYHTFENGGEYLINLRVTNVDFPVYSAEFSRIITLEPVFGANKIEFNPIPNVFSPNEDGVNDTFEVIASGTTTLSFKVFARSGALVYLYEGNVIKWNGKNDYGKDIPDGIYYYTLEDIGEQQYNPAKGFFYILRGE